MTRRPDKQLEALKSELDPDGSHGLRKVWAALTYCGVEVEDLEPGFVDKGPALHEKVPKDRKEDIQSQRKHIREGLRQQRLQQVREALQGLTDDDVRRLENCRGGGVRPVTHDDLPPAGEIQGVAEIMEKMNKSMDEVRKMQERKATAICVDFLTSKKRAEDADKQIKDLEDRLLAAKKEQEAEWKTKRIALQKAQETRTAKVNKANQERATWENETQRKADERLQKARATRAHTYSTEKLAEKMGAGNAKRDAAYFAAIELEERTLADIQERQRITEERLARDRAELAERLEQRRQDQHRVFVEKQIAVHAMQQEWAEKKGKAHEDFMKHFHDSRATYNDLMKARSKSVGDIKKKATDKWKANYDRLMAAKGKDDAELMKKLSDATHKVEHELKPMKLKCGGDVFSHLEVKEKTFGDLVNRRRMELQKSQDAKTQALLLKLAERHAKETAKEDSQNEVRLKRVEAAKETLRYSNEASAVFLKIKCENNEDRIRKAMGGLGFKMPKVGNGEEELVATEA